MLNNVTSQTNQTYYIQLDGLRFLAVISVMLGHWLAIGHLKSILGGIGVNLFFVLSGFLIAGILIRNKNSIQANESTLLFSVKQFYIRRFLRIFPIYYLVILISYIINFELCRKIIWWLLSYTSNIYWIINGPLIGHFAHLWSLAVEEQFYILFPFFILLTPKRLLPLFLSIIICFSPSLRLILLCFLHSKEVSTYSLMPCCLDSFALGAILAFLLIFNKKKLSQILNLYWLLIVNLFFFLLCSIYPFLPSSFHTYFFTIFSEVFTRLFFSICCFWIIGVSVLYGFKGIIKLFLENKLVVYLGRISYGLYVYHFFMSAFSPYLHWQILLPVFLRLHISFPFTNNTYWVAAWYFILTLLISTISWYLVETPLNKLKKHFKYMKTE